MEDNNKDMHIKFQKGSPNGISDNKGSSRDLAEYLNHEDRARIEKGLAPIPFITPEGEEVPTEEVIRAIDDNAKGLGKADTKFFHMVVAPSQEEIEAMGEDDKEVYRNALYYLKIMSDAYARQFNREEIKDSSNIEIFWKAHFTREDNDVQQFHLHAIISRMTKEIDGKKRKISPFTNHREQTAGPIKGGFNRRAFAELGEKIFDQLFDYERKVAKTFEYQNALVHGTVEDKAAQAERLAQETISQMKEKIKVESAKKKDEENKLTQAEEPEQLIASVGPKEVKNEILDVFRKEQDSTSLYLALAILGVTCTMEYSKDGIEDVSFEKDGATVSYREILTNSESEQMFFAIHQILGKESAAKVRERRTIEEMRKVSQRKHGGPKLGR